MNVSRSKVTRGWVISHVMVGAAALGWAGASESGPLLPLGVTVAVPTSSQVVHAAGLVRLPGAPGGDGWADTRHAFYVLAISGTSERRSATGEQRTQAALDASFTRVNQAPQAKQFETSSASDSAFVRVGRFLGFSEVAGQTGAGWNGQGGAGGVMAALALGALGWAFRRQPPVPPAEAGAEPVSQLTAATVASFGERREAIEFLETSCSASAAEAPVGKWIYGLGAVENLADINRTLGWSGGDAVVTEAARHLRTLEPAAACVLRISGNRLCVAIWSHSFQEAAEWFSTARQSVADATVPPTEMTFGLTYRRPEEPVGSLLERLDYLLLDARRSGVMWVSADMQSRAPRTFDAGPDRDPAHGFGAAEPRREGISRPF